MSDGSTLTVVSIFLPKRRSSALLSPASSVSPSGNALVICAVLEVCEKVANVREQSYPVGTDQHPHEVAAVGVEPVGADRQKQRFLVAGRKLRVVQRRAHFPIACDRRRDPEHLGPYRQRVLLARKREHRFGVGSGNGDLFGHGQGYSCFCSAASNSACAFASTSRLRICPAPATARSATWLRSASFARETSC